MSENKNVTYQNLSDIPKAVLRENFLVVNGYIRKEEKSQIKN